MTGGGSGIGRELARQFQALGNTVIVAGRRAAALEETIGGREHM
ncbi:MAG TPA: SDR family NAD(P)-dependent oxidoreductase, partial [Hyphomonas sp.]|nr:SDR family NAD(P)-dependent oxidoreductase [Hyphomonas sp.]